MANTLQEYSGTLVVDRCWCGIQHAIPASLHSQQQHQHENGLPQTGIYCPLGHTYVRRGTSKADKLATQLTRERACHDQTRAELRETEARRRGEKAAKTRLKARIAKGVCPCCKRHFVNLQRHMTTQHPDYPGE